MNECLKGQRGILGVKDPKEEESMGHLRPCGFAAGKKTKKYVTLMLKLVLVHI